MSGIRFSAPLEITTSAAIGDVAHPSWRGSAVGVYRLWRDGGYAVGALLAGALADAFGMAVAIAVIGGLTALSGLQVAIRMPETLTTIGGRRTPESRAGVTDARTERSVSARS